MSPEQFAYWLQGFVENNKGAMPTPEQWKSVCAHLNTVFKNVTASRVPVDATSPTDFATLLQRAVAAQRQHLQSSPRQAKRMLFDDEVWPPRSPFLIC